MASPLFLLLLLISPTLVSPTSDQEDSEEAPPSSLYASFGDEVIPSTSDDVGYVFAEEDDPELDSTTLPTHFDYRKVGIVSPALKQTVSCSSCTYHAATLITEARMARVSEHYVRYSVQGLMNCMNKTCVGGTSFNNWKFYRTYLYISRYEEQGYVENKCKSTEEGCVCGMSDQKNYPNAFNEQFAFVGPTIKPGSKEGIMRALQSGPMTAVVAKGVHVTTLVGYNDTKWIVQDSLGPTYGVFKDGSWGVAYGSNNDALIQQHAQYTKIFYDYNRANAYYTPGEGVAEKGLVFVDSVTWAITRNNTADKGLAKNKCAFLGSVCKGVVRIGDTFKLVSDFSSATPGDLMNERKTQMVIYLRHQASGEYIILEKEEDKVWAMTGAKSKASPFFSSLGRLVSYDYPDYDLSGAAMHRFPPSISPYDREPSETWTMNHCMLLNPTSGLALAKVPLHLKADTIGSASPNFTDPDQRFTVGLSGDWVLKHNGTKLRIDHKMNYLVFNDKTSIRWSEEKFRWNARQVIQMSTGQALESNFSSSRGLFKFGEDWKEQVPTDCKLHTGHPRRYLDVVDSNVVTRTLPSGGWSFEYADLQKGRNDDDDNGDDDDDDDKNSASGERVGILCLMVCLLVKELFV